MLRSKLWRATIGTVAIGCAVPASAAIVEFSGSVTARGVVTPDPSCSTGNRGSINPATSSGASTLGAFTFGHAVCTAGAPGGPIFGSFTIDFGGDSFFGSLTGLSAANPTMAGIFDFTIAYTVLGGTGRFLGATGAFSSGPGSNANTAFRPSQITLNFQNGLINAPAIPEPRTWAMLLVGFGTIGWSLRRRAAGAVSAGPARRTRVHGLAS